MPEVTLQQISSEYQQVHNDLQSVAKNISTYGEEQKKINAKIRDIQQRLERSKGGLIYDGDYSNSAGYEIAASLAEAPGFRQLADSGKGNAAVQFKAPLAAVIGTDGKAGTGMTTVPTEHERTGYVTGPTLALSLLDVLPSRSTSKDAVEHIRFGISSGEAETQIKEGDEKAELSMEGKLVTANIETIAATQPASRQVLDDNAGLQSLIESILMKEVRRKLEQRILYGDGVDNTILGLTGIGTAYAPTATTTVDKIGECVTTMQNEGFNPTVIAIRATQWFSDVATLKDKNGQYIIGNPADPAKPTLWTGNIVKPASLLANTVLVIDPTYVTVLDRQAVQVLISESHKDYFTRNLIQILCELRAGLEVTHAKAVRIINLA